MQRALDLLHGEKLFADPVVSRRVKEFSDIVGHDLFFFTRNFAKGTHGLNVGRRWYDYLLERHLGVSEDADSFFRKGVLAMGLSRDDSNLLLSVVKKGAEVSILSPESTIRTVVHEISHTLAARIGVRMDKPSPKNVVDQLRKELPGMNYPDEWINRSHELCTEILTQYFLRNYFKDKGLDYIKDGSYIFQFAEELLKQGKDPTVSSMIGWALGLALGVTGAYKEALGGRSGDVGRVSGESSAGTGEAGIQGSL